ncbi:MAG: ATP-binding protein [Kofleriaceae bacterium]
MGGTGGPEGIRARPGMYAGDAYHLMWEVIANALDLYLRREATEIRVELGADSWVTVRDDGPGIPPDQIETIFTKLFPNGYDRHVPHVHLTSDLRGAGLCPVNALCSHLDVDTASGGLRYQIAFERGRIVSPLRQVGAAFVEGTSVRFHPDPTIFPSIVLDQDVIATRLQELAWLNPYLRLYFQNRRLESRGGIASWLGPTRPGFATQHTHGGVTVDLALGWTDSRHTNVRCFVNMTETTDGTHLDGIWDGLSRIAGWSREDTRDALAPGFVAIVAVGLHRPELANPTKDHLTHPLVGEAVSRAIQELPDPALQAFVVEQLAGRQTIA